MADISFEKNLTELEKINQNLSRSDLPLEQAIAEYERGVSLAGEALKYLNSSEKKVKKLIEDKGQISWVDFEASE